MEKIRAIKLYVLRDKNNLYNLYLYIGVAYNADGTPKSNVRNLRCMIRGAHNPIPVRNGTWFEGFGVTCMLDWLNKHGFYKATNVIDLTCIDVPSQKGNKSSSHNGNEHVDAASTLDSAQVLAYNKGG